MTPILAGIMFLKLLPIVAAIAPKCVLIHDGRIPSSTPSTSLFDTLLSPFNPTYVKGASLKFSQILSFPSVVPSSFDQPGYKPVEVLITDASIFTPGSGPPQNGFRRAGLTLAANTGSSSDASTVGVKTFHWSVRPNSSRALNLSHEYLAAWHEKNDYNGNQFGFEIGTLIGRETESEKSEWKILNRKDAIIWKGTSSEEWQNFAVKLDYNQNTIQIFHSTGGEVMKNVTDVLENDNSGGGQFQIGILKKPTGNTQDVVHEGYQETGIEESLIYGSLFIEDSRDGCNGLGTSSFSRKIYLFQQYGRTITTHILVEGSGLDPGTEKLLIPIRERYTDRVQKYLYQGASLAAYDSDEYTPLHRAVRSTEKIMHIIIEAVLHYGNDGIDAPLLRGGKTALHVAGALGLDGMGKVLLDSGAHLYALDDEGKTSFETAVVNHRSDWQPMARKRLGRRLGT